MHCEKAEMLLPLLVFDEIDDGEKVELMAHLSECSACSEKLGDLRVTMNLLRDGFAAAPAPVLSAERKSKLMKKLAKPPTRGKSKKKKATTFAGLPLSWLTPSQWKFRPRFLHVAAGLAIAVGLAGLFMPALGTARRTARQMQSSTHARGIHSGLVLESQERGTYSADLDKLVEGNYVSPEYLISPNDTRGIQVPSDLQSWPKEKRSAWINENSSYALVRPGDTAATNDSSRIVLFEKPSPGQERISIVFDDNRSENLSVAEAEKLIKQNTGKSIDEWSESSKFAAKLRKAQDQLAPEIPALTDGSKGEALLFDDTTSTRLALQDGRRSGGIGGGAGNAPQTNWEFKSANREFAGDKDDRFALSQSGSGGESSYRYRNQNTPADFDGDGTIVAGGTVAPLGDRGGQQSSSARYNAPLPPPVVDNSTAPDSFGTNWYDGGAKTGKNSPLEKSAAETRFATKDGEGWKRGRSDDFAEHDEPARPTPRPGGQPATAAPAKPGRTTSVPAPTTPAPAAPPESALRPVIEGLAHDIPPATTAPILPPSSGPVAIPAPIVTSKPATSSTTFTPESNRPIDSASIAGDILPTPGTKPTGGTENYFGEASSAKPADPAGPASSFDQRAKETLDSAAGKKFAALDDLTRRDLAELKGDALRPSDDKPYSLTKRFDDSGVKSNMSPDDALAGLIDRKKRSEPENQPDPRGTRSPALGLALEDESAPQGKPGEEKLELGQEAAGRLGLQSARKEGELREMLKGESGYIAPGKDKKEAESLSDQDESGLFGREGKYDDAKKLASIIAPQNGKESGREEVTKGIKALTDSEAKEDRLGDVEGGKTPAILDYKADGELANVARELERTRSDLARKQAEIANLASSNEQYAKIQADLQKELGAIREESTIRAKQLIELEAANNDQSSATATLRRQVRLAQENLVKTQEELAETNRVLSLLPPEVLAKHNKPAEADYGVVRLSDSKDAVTRRTNGEVEKQEAVQKLLRRAAELRKTQEYDRSLQLINQALFVDPQNPAAESMKSMIEATQINGGNQEFMRVRNLRFARHQTEMIEATIPYNELITYPSDWPHLSQASNGSRALTLDDLVPPVEGEESSAIALAQRTAKAREMTVQLRAEIDELRKNGNLQSAKITDHNGLLILQGTEAEQQIVTQRLHAIQQSQTAAAGKGVRPQNDPASDGGELQPAANFRLVPVNPWTLTQADAQSTFALDVDTASYTLGRRYIQRGFLPPAGSVRMEEYINAFDYNYVNNSSDVFRIHVDGAPAPFAPTGEANTKLIKVGVKGKVIGRDGRKPANLVLVVDTSGSMARPDRLPLIQHSLELLIDQLSEHDTVSLVTFGSDVLTHLAATPASNKDAIRTAINSLQANGPTNLLKGVEAGYKLAAQAHKSGSINRVIVCSDGIATLGETEADTILTYVENYRKQGISCTAIGFGAGAYDDDMMEKLANKGDGTYHFVDSKREARKVFVDDLTATLQTIAKDAKIQVEFNKDRVRRYRLIGYENRAVADKDFRNDTIDAGEVGSGQSSTALYEVELIGDEQADIGTVYVRYRNADTEKIEEISQRLTSALIRERSPKEDPRFFLAACAAEFAELLRSSEHATGGSLAKLQGLLEQTVPHLPLDEKAAELLDLVRKAQGLPRAP